MSTITRTSAPPRITRPGVTLAVIVLCQLMIGLDSSIVTIALPQIQNGLHLSGTGLAWIQNSYMLAFGGLLLLGGRAGDILGRRRVFLAGVSLFTLASLAGGLASAGWFLLTARTLQGVGAAVAGPSTMALIAANFEGGARVRALSVFSAVTGAGGAIGMLAGGLLTDWASWRSAFFVNIPIGLVLLALAPRFVAETQRRPGRFDLPGALTSTVGMTALVYGFIRAASAGWHDSLTVGSLLAAVILLGLFLALESRAVQPIMPLGLFGDRDRSAAYAAMLLLCAAMFGMFFFLTQFLQEVLGFGPLKAGLAFLPMVLMQFTCVRTLPRFLPRLGAKTISGAGAVSVTLGLLWLAQISASSGYLSGVLGPLVLMGMGGGLSIMPLNMTILSRVPPAESGAASGLAQTMVWGGGALGSAVLVTVYGAATAHPAGPIQIHGMTTAFAVATAFSTLALLIILTLRPR
ncbi:MAG: transrane efflux protein [Actinomycetia bacterium]|nr:transrane efflux protein [Actinomycetes bacterium]